MDFSSCPYCQSNEIELPNNRLLRCNDCKRSYYHNAAAAVAGILMVDDEVLLNVRKKAPGEGLLDLVGGFVDFEESLEQALTRETKEELGIEVINWTYFCSLPNTYVYDAVTYHTVDSVFVAHLDKKPILNIQQSELLDALWCSTASIPYEQFAFNSLKNALKRFVTSN